MCSCGDIKWTWLYLSIVVMIDRMFLMGTRFNKRSNHVMSQCKIQQTFKRALFGTL